MSKSSIEWTESTWNPVTGCSKVSAGCKNCYAERMAYRLGCMGQSRYQTVIHNPDTIPMDKIGTWIGNTHFVESALSIPLKRKKATTYFVCSMSDLFHPTVPFEWIDKVFAVMALCPQHTFQVLTKRQGRMAEYLNQKDGNLNLRPPYIEAAGRQLLEENMLLMKYWKDRLWLDHNTSYTLSLPLPNVWLGTTAEDQAMADERIPELLKCPAAKRFVSIEPMLEAVDIGMWLPNFLRCSTASSGMCKWTGPFDGAETKINEYGDDEEVCGECGDWAVSNPVDDEGELDWVICGGESGPGARPMHPDWARGVRDQCKAAGVPFFFKQWGAWLPLGQGGSAAGSWMDNSHRSKDGEPMYKVTDGYDNLIGTGISHHFDNLGQTTYRIGKKKAGSLLDGVEHKEMPEKN